MYKEKKLFEFLRQHPKIIITACAVFIVPLIFAAKAHAAYSCSTGFMCAYDVGAYSGADQPIVIWNDNPGHNFSASNPTVRPGQTLNFQIGFRSGQGTNQTVMTWISIRNGNNVLSGIGGAQWGDMGNCFNVVANYPKTQGGVYPGYGSPYRNDAWRAGGGGGTFMCDPAGAKPPPYAGHMSPTGSSAAWWNAGAGPGTTLHNLSMTVSPNVAAQSTFCFRNHVSVQRNGPNPSPGSTESPPVPDLNGEFGGVMGNVMGVGGSSGGPAGNMSSPICFNIVPDFPPQGDIGNVTCDGVDLIAYDRNVNGVPISTSYSVWRQKLSTGAWDNPMGNSSSAAGSWFRYPLDQTDDFIQSPNIRYDVYALNLETNAWVLVSSETHSATCDFPPTYNLSATCAGVQITNLQDPDRPGQGVYWEIIIFHNNGGTVAATQTGRTYGNTAVLPIPPEDNVNGGWRVEARVKSLRRLTGVDLEPLAYLQQVQVAPCYSATCSLDVVEDPTIPTNPTNGVKGGTTFRVNATFRNIGPLPIDGGAASVTFNNRAPENTGHYWGRPAGLNFFPVGGSPLGPGVSRTTSFTLTAPRGVAPRSPVRIFYPDWAGRFAVGPECNMTVDVYEEFHMQPGAGTMSLSPDEESPTSAQYAWSVDNTNSWGPSRTTVTRNVTKNGAPFGSRNSSHTIDPPAGSTDTHGISTWALGDNYCATTTVSPSDGWQGPSRQIVTVPSKTSAPPSCAEVSNKPYFRAYGNDVVAGGGFGAACSGSRQDIKANMRPASEHTAAANRSGSGSQLAALATGNIEGFISASLRTSSPLAPRDLTFSKSTAALSGLSPSMGGSLAVSGFCMPDYFTNTQWPDGSKMPDRVTDRKTVTSSNGTINPDSLDNERQTVRNIPSGGLQVQGATNYTKRHTVYVDGDVFISGNIEYTPNYATGIPNFTLVVKGNIFINNTVTRLDGLYIAQPDERSNSGRIFTCANSLGSAMTSAPSLFSNCGARPGTERQLVVNGAFIAQKVVLNRTGFSLRDSRFREPASTSRAIEIFNFSPEMYLSPPVFVPNKTQTSSEYQYLTTMPPVL